MSSMIGDIRAVIDRMKSRRLLPVRGVPDDRAGVILSIAAFARAEKRRTGFVDIKKTIDWYAEYAAEDPVLLRIQIEGYWRDCGNWSAPAEDVIEVLSL